MNNSFILEYLKVGSSFYYCKFYDMINLIGSPRIEQEAALQITAGTKY